MIRNFIEDYYKKIEKEVLKKNKFFKEGKVSYNQSGYVKYSKSERAIEAEENDEYPISKWTKEMILDKVKEYYSNYYEKFKSFNLSQLKNIFLYYSGWHHTGMYATKTDYYGFDIDIDDSYLMEVTKAEKIKTERPKEQFKVVRATYDYWYGSKTRRRMKERTDLFIFGTNKIARGYNYEDNKNISSLYDKKELGVFDTQEEAEEFIKSRN